MILGLFFRIDSKEYNSLLRNGIYNVLLFIVFQYGSAELGWGMLPLVSIAVKT